MQLLPAGARGLYTPFLVSRLPRDHCSRRNGECDGVAVLMLHCSSHSVKQRISLLHTYRLVCTYQGSGSGRACRCPGSAGCSALVRQPSPAAVLLRCRPRLRQQAYSRFVHAAAPQLLVVSLQVHHAGILYEHPSCSVVQHRTSGRQRAPALMRTSPNGRSKGNCAPAARDGTTRCGNQLPAKLMDQP